MNELAATVLVLAVAEVVAVGDPGRVGPGQEDLLSMVVDKVCALNGHSTSCTCNAVIDTTKLTSGGFFLIFFLNNQIISCQITSKV